MKVVSNMNNENNKIVCDGKSIMNIFMFIVCFSASIILTYMLIKYEIRTLNSTLGLINLILTIVFVLFIFLSMIYLLLKILNFSFYINNDQVIYNDIWKKKHSYCINDIKDSKQFFSGKKTGIIITMNDDITIRVVDLDRNYRHLRKYLMDKHFL